MDKTRKLILCGMLTSIIVIIELMPVLIAEPFAIVTIFSSLTLIMAAKIDKGFSVFSYIIAASIISSIDIKQGVMFIATNGIVGLSIGNFSQFIKNKVVCIFLCAAALFFSIVFVNFFIGFNVFYIPMNGYFPLVSIMLYTFCFAYVTGYYLFQKWFFKKFENAVTKFLT
jgi:hypothetical protein